MKRAGALPVFVAVLLCTAMAASAAQSVDLIRDEVAALKKKLVAATTAIGAPTGYRQEKENFSLPTSALTAKGAGRFQAVQPGVTYTFASVAAKEGKRAREENKKENEKKLQEAAMKGDMAAMQKYLNAAAEGDDQDEKDSPQDQLGLRIELNAHGDWPIDPDRVVFEKPGVIAMAAQGDDTGESLGNGKSAIMLFFDPVALKETKQLSKIVLKRPEEGVASKTTIVTAWVVLNGPPSEIKKWANKIDTAAMLSLIDAR